MIRYMIQHRLLVLHRKHFHPIVDAVLFPELCIRQTFYNVKQLDNLKFRRRVVMFLFFCEMTILFNWK